MKVREAERILRVSAPYTEQNIIKSFRLRSRETHPDRPGGSNKAFNQVCQAKELLLETIRELADLEEEDGPLEGEADLYGSDEPDPIGRSVSVLHIEIDGRAHPASTMFRSWITMCGKKKDRMAFAFQPPSPIRVVERAEFIVVFDGDAVSDAIRLSGPVIERSYGDDNLVILFCIDPF